MHPRFRERRMDTLLRPNTVTAKVFDIIARAAEEGLPAPSNEEMADETASMNSNISDSLRALDAGRFIQIEWDGPAPTFGKPGPRARRRFRVMETGEVTAWTAHGVRRSKGKTRPCMICTADFDSEGPHHRLCTKCRSWAGNDGSNTGAAGTGKTLSSHAPRGQAPVTLPRIRSLDAGKTDLADAYYGGQLHKELARRMEREGPR